MSGVKSLTTIHEIEYPPTVLEEALDLLVERGYNRSEVRIPLPVKSNIQQDRIYFNVKDDGTWRALTAFIDIVVDPICLEVEVVEGWPIERVAATP